MTIFVYHQNCQRFGGRSPDKCFNLEYATELAALALATASPGYQVAVAGFTEITNSGPSANTGIADVAHEIDVDLTSTFVVFAGYSTLKNPEYLGVAFNPNLIAVDYVGVVLPFVDSLYPNQMGFQCYYDTFANVQNLAQVPTALPNGQPFTNRASPYNGYRGLVFVAGQMNGTHWLIFFVHNVYSDNPSTTCMSKLTNFVQTALNSVPGYANATVIVGGDFNVPPYQRNSYLTPAAAMQNGQPVKTTNRNSFDYWFGNAAANMQNANAYAFRQTIGNGTDHAAVAYAVT